MGYTKDNIEVEQKYLIKMPNVRKIIEYYGIYHPQFKLLRQDYLKDIDSLKGFTSRIRAERIFAHFSWDNRDIFAENYYFTYKKYIKNGTRYEYENPISLQEYQEYSKIIDKSYMSILKRRICIPYTFEDGFHTDLEIDIYPFWKSQAILEVEVDSINRGVSNVKGISIIKNVTDDIAYSNYNLAKHHGRVDRD